MKRSLKWFGFAFLIGAIFSSGSVLASTSSVPATITVKEDVLAAAISPTSLSFNPQVGAFSHEEIQIENTGQVAFYPSVTFTNFSDETKIEERGVTIERSNRLLFEAGNSPLDLEVPVTYPKGKQAVTVGEIYRIPLSVGAGSLIEKGSNVNLTFDVEVTLDKVMETIENLQATVNGSDVNLTWDPFNVEGIEASQYSISIFKYNLDTQQFERYLSRKVTPNTSYVWTGLDAGTDYRFEVTPLVDTHYRKKSMSSIDVNVPNEAIGNGDEIVAPTHIQNLQATVNGTDITLTWDSFSYEGIGANRYRIKGYVFNEGTNQYERYQTNKTTYTTSYNWTSLEKGKKYKFEVIPSISGYREDLLSMIEVEIPN